MPGFKRSGYPKITFLRTEKAKNVNKRREKKPFFSLLFAAAYECIQCKRLLGAQKSDLRIARSFEPGHSEEKELRFGCSPLLTELAHTNLTQNSTIQFDALLVSLIVLIVCPTNRRKPTMGTRLCVDSLRRSFSELLVNKQFSFLALGTAKVSELMKRSPLFIGNAWPKFN